MFLIVSIVALPSPLVQHPTTAKRQRVEQKLPESPTPQPPKPTAVLPAGIDHYSPVDCFLKVL